MMDHISSYRILWLFVLFDLPVGTKTERRAATKFRNSLLDIGFEMSQFSVYVKWLHGYESVDAVTKTVQRNTPAAGKIHILTITDKQFEKMITITGLTEKSQKKLPEQFELF